MLRTSSSTSIRSTSANAGMHDYDTVSTRRPQNKHQNRLNVPPPVSVLVKPCSLPENCLLEAGLGFGRSDSDGQTITEICPMPSGLKNVAQSKRSLFACHPSGSRACQIFVL